MIRLLATLAAALAASGAAPCQAQTGPQTVTTQPDPESLAIANEIIDLAFPPDTRDAMLMRTADTMMEQARVGAMAAIGADLDAGTRQILERYLEHARAESARVTAESSATLFVAWARAYARLFTRQELVEIRAFVRTPTGARYFQEASALLSDPDVARANTAHMAAVFAALRPLQDELRQELMEYLESRARESADSGHLS